MGKLIDVDALRYDLCACLCGAYDHCQEWCHTLKVINMQPVIDAQPVRHGRWVPTEYDGYADGNPVWDKWECSECGNEHKGEEDSLTAFCPDCGARMAGEEKSRNDTTVRHGYWIECDYKHIEHGMIETEPNAGLCCSVCNVGIRKKDMTYKQYCPHCGAQMDGGEDNG